VAREIVPSLLTKAASGSLETINKKSQRSRRKKKISLKNKRKTGRIVCMLNYLRHQMIKIMFKRKNLRKTKRKPRPRKRTRSLTKSKLTEKK